MDPRGRAIRAVRGRRIAMVFQEPMSSLSHMHTIGAQIEEALALHLPLDRAARRARTTELLRQVEIPEPERAAQSYPFQYSGGMRQRAMIAMALACNPRVLVADEPTTALDVTTQAEILDLMRGLQERHGMAMLFITHDMGVVAEIADEVAVMRHGRLVEHGSVDAVFHAPQHPYTRMLLGAVKQLQRRAAQKPPPPAQPAPPVLSVRGLGKSFRRRSGMFGGGGGTVQALADVDLDLATGESLGIVGESGSGKTTLGRCILRLEEPSAGRVTYRDAEGRDHDVTAMDRQRLQRVYADIRMVFQDPFASLNPRMTVRQIVAEPLVNLGIATKAEIADRVGWLLARVGLRPEHMERYPHAFSGGQRQRIGIARALASRPRVVIADEPTSVLDVSIRTRVLDLLLELQQEFALSFIFISHDLSVIRYFCDRVAVMHRGHVVEIGSTEQVCDAPRHAYTRALLSAVPTPDPRRRTAHLRHRYAA
jgi:peptide/nickel transport system ATP-binding protein